VCTSRFRATECRCSRAISQRARDSNARPSVSVAIAEIAREQRLHDAAAIDECRRSAG
jgi:hypothetical protein